MSGIFDSHAHYDDARFDEDRDITISHQFENGVEYILNCASDLESAEKTILLCNQFEHMYGAVGIHPHEADGADLSLIESQLEKLCRGQKIVAIGEIGLDYHYDFSERDIQKQVFEKQIETANRLNIPVIIHDREAHQDTYEILKRLKPKGVIHCFSGSVELLNEAVKLGLYIGLGGAVTFKNAVTPKEIAKQVPIERLLLETDAPYMAPVPHRSKRCESTMIAETAKQIAEIREMNVTELINITSRNARNLFHIS